MITPRTASIAINNVEHASVLFDAVLQTLNPLPRNIVCDCTVGLGGHASAFAHAIGKGGTLLCIDADEVNLASARSRVESAHPGCSLRFIHANFRDLASLDLPPVDILFADLGLSSPHIDDPKRGFSFRADGPLDLRFDQSTGFPASDLLNTRTLDELTAMFRTYAELDRAYPFVKAIIEARSISPIVTTSALVRVAESVYSWKVKQVLPQIFQALRIAVNDEMGALDALLSTGPMLLNPGGRMGIISFHSLEDRRVKQCFRSLTTVQRHPVTGAPLSDPPFQLLTKKPLTADEDELAENPRARSAKFRAILKSV